MTYYNEVFFILRNGRVARTKIKPGHTALHRIMRMRYVMCALVYTQAQYKLRAPKKTRTHTRTDSNEQ